MPQRAVNKNASSAIATNAAAISARTDRATLRRRLADRLRQVIGNPVIEEKELAAFDIVMSRREVLKLGGGSLMVAGLVAAGVPPTVWGQHDPSLGVHPCEVGLTPEEQASVTVATQLGIGTELFQQTIYAEPVVSPQAAATHAVIEGARHRYRLQSVLDSVDPTEADFLDRGHHWGPPELVQLEDTTNGWELVHYRHPWSEREDGATTAGLVRDVIMTAADGLSKPVKVLTISSPCNNLVTADGKSGAAYFIVVIDRAADGGGFLCVGTGTWAMTASPGTPPEYPVEWKSMGLTYVLREVGSAQGHELWWDDKYVDMGHADPANPAEYDPVKSTEHIVLYYDNGPRVITLADNRTPGYAYLWIDMLLYPLAGQPRPTFDTTPRLIHLETNTDVSASGNSPPYQTQGLWFASNIKNSDGTYVFTTVSVGHGGSIQREELDVWPEQGIYGRNQQYDNATQNATEVYSRAPPPGGTQLDYTHVFNVHAFYATDDGYFVKLANFANVGLALFVVVRPNGLSPTLAGHFPLAMPDVAGIGNISVLSGGVSKFDGFRFVASDANASLFLLRHRRAISSSTPYSAPIYGFNDADGNPRSYYSPNTRDPFPAGVDANSNLHTLDAWMTASSADLTTRPRNILLNAALAFATDDSALAQGIWLGSGFQAAYAPRRFPFDSAYVVIKRAQGGGDNDFSAYVMHNNVVTKTWHTRQIAAQVLPKDPGLNESGDHYHATVTPMNAYGSPVSLLTSDNANLVIEVRADAPTTVVDDTHNLYYDIDRYTSFMAAPDSGTGRLALAVSADSFSLVLYARLVDTSGLTPSGDDPAMLASTGTVYPWQSANLAAQAQQRMGNDLSDTVTQLGDAAPLADTTQYISGDSLTTASTEGSWQFKGGFQPSGGNSGNLGSLASYLNTSGQTMLGASPELSLGASPDGVTFDPLTAVTLTAPSKDISGGATFAYAAGTVTPVTTSTGLALGRQPKNDELGNAWSSVSHALHDALQWLQNVAPEVFKDLAEGGAVGLNVAAGGISATVSADIMKAVNGVEQELNEVISTIEEYASVVVNVITTIVEQSFLYKLIEDIIALISLFWHLKDIWSLADSLQDRLQAILSGPAQLPADYSSWELFQDYFGPDNVLADQMNSLDVSPVETEIVNSVLDEIPINPMTSKVLNKVLSSVIKSIEDELPTPPISFSPNDAIADQAFDELLALENDMITAVEKVTEDVIGDVISQITADLANPRQTYSNLADGLETLVAQIEVDVLKPILDWTDDVVRSWTDTAEEAINQDPLIAVDLTALKDLFHLFGIGRKVNDTYSVSAADAVFIPMAIIVWETVYTLKGKSISSIDDLDSTSPSPLPGPFASPISKTDLALVNLTMNFVSAEMKAFLWSAKAAAATREESFPGGSVDAQVGALVSFIRRGFNCISLVAQNDDTPAGNWPWSVWVEFAYFVAQFAFSIRTMFTVHDPRNTGTGWPSNPTLGDLLNLAGTISTIGVTGLSVWQTFSDSPSDSDIIAVTGQTLGRSQGVAMFLWDLLLGQTPDPDAFVLWNGYILAAPYGWVLQAGAVSGELGAPGGGHGSCPRNKGKGKGNGQP